MRSRTAFVAVVLATALSAPGGAAEKNVKAFSFSCPAPSSWSSRHEGDEVVLTAPSDKSGVAVRIWIRRVPRSHPLFGTPDAYIKRHARRLDVAPASWKTGNIEEILVAGRKAERIVNDMSEMVPPSSPSQKEVLTREEHVAVPAAEGFYALVYSAPRSTFVKNRAAFAAVLAGFKPKD